jgi:hypothetical protein
MPEDWPICRPPADQRSAYQGALQDTLTGLLAKMPEQADLAQTFNQNTNSPEGQTPTEGDQAPPDPRRVYQLFRWTLRLSVLVPLLFLLAAGLFGGRTLKSRLAWWGFPSLIVGLIGIGLALAVGPIIRQAFELFVLNRLPPTAAPGMAQVGLDLAAGLGGQVALWIGSEAVVLVVLGLILIVTASRRRKDNSGRDPAPPPPASLANSADVAS